MRNRLFFSTFLWLTLVLTGFSQQARLHRIEPPSWWVGFRNSGLQLLVHGTDIASCHVTVDYPGLVLKKVNKCENPNYLFLDLTVSPGTKPGNAPIRFIQGNKEVARYLFELKARKKGSAERKSFTSADVIYLLMPDRFANGDTANDSFPGFLEKADRTNKDGRHGGDLMGIANHLDHLTDLGITALWLNPVLENNMGRYSYHGYATTDYYRVDPRIGSNEAFASLAQSLHEKGIKLIMDMIFNHCGSNHWWMNDLPARDWINQWPAFTRTNYRAGSVTDPYTSRSDSNLFLRGWFDESMPDLNQENPYVRNYLIQNSIWWIEYASLDGIRMDTHPYPSKGMMAQWGKRILAEYPNFNMVGECWLNHPSSVAYWQKGALNRDGYNSWLPSVLDFPLYDALGKAFTETDGWNTGIVRLYETLGQDFNYADPSKLVTFADNHDVNRYLDSQNDDVRNLKLAMAFLLTTRGIPQIYYGTEILLSVGPDKSGDGNKRKDFPGGWPDDQKNAFTDSGRTPAEADMYLYLKRLIRWRQTTPAVQTGKLRHFIPSGGVYVYFRSDDAKTVMVILNRNEGQQVVETTRYSEILTNFKTGREIITDTVVSDLTKITVPGKTACIMELSP